MIISPPIQKTSPKNDGSLVPNISSYYNISLTIKKETSLDITTSSEDILKILSNRIYLRNPN